MGHPLDTPTNSEGFLVHVDSREKPLVGPQGEGTQISSHLERWRQPRRHRPWLRMLVALFIAMELMITILVGELAPVYDFYLTSVVTVNGSTEIARNPDLTYPIKMGGGTLCRPYELDECLVDNPPSSVCCTELLSSSSSGPEELITTIMMFGYCVVIPGLILLMRGFLLGRVWVMSPCSLFSDEGDAHEPMVTGNRPEGGWGKRAWGKERWHLRVGFYSLDTCLGLVASIVTALMFTAILKVVTGRPRPNYWALRIFTENAFNGDDFSEIMKRGWPSGHSSTSAAGLLFLAHVLWADLMALVQWRRQEHPRITLLMAVLGGFVMTGLPLCSILIGVSRIRDYWHRPDEVLAGLVLGAVCAHWCFRFVVLTPFNHEIGAPEWTPYPKWEEEGQNDSQRRVPGARDTRRDRMSNDGASTPSTKSGWITLEQQQQQQQQQHPAAPMGGSPEPV